MASSIHPLTVANVGLLIVHILPAVAKMCCLSSRQQEALIPIDLGCVFFMKSNPLIKLISHLTPL
jgi:hypothetical protein